MSSGQVWALFVAILSTEASGWWRTIGVAIGLALLVEDDRDRRAARRSGGDGP